MNSSINHSTELSNSPASAPNQTTELTGLHREQPIPPPSEPMQYRAIGLVRGRYQAGAEQFTQGTLLASDGTEIDAVLLGRIMSLVKNHLDLAKEHLWVVYPRSGQKEDNLHLQIVGVWEPEKLSRQQSTTTKPTPGQQDSTVEDGYFSVRGEIVYQSVTEGNFVVKIKQASRKISEPPKFFKLKLQGNLGTKAVGQFWDLHLLRQANALVLQHGQAIAVLPSKQKPKKHKPYPSKPKGPKRQGQTPRPVLKAGDTKSPTSKPGSKPPSPKPIKRQKPPQ